MGLPVVMMASADEGGAGGLSRRQNLDNPTAPRQPQGLGVRLNQRAYVILCDVPADCFILFHTAPTSCASCCRIPASEPRGSPDIGLPSVKTDARRGKSRPIRDCTR